MYKFVRLAELYYAGSHGMDIKGPAKGSKYKKVSVLFYHGHLICPRHFFAIFPNNLFLFLCLLDHSSGQSRCSLPTSK